MADIQPRLIADPVPGVTPAVEDGGYSIAADNWQRFQYGLTRGHKQYTETAAMLEGFYMGGGYDRDGNLLPGGHWNEADLAVLEEQGRPAYEVSQIKPGIDSAFGYQIANRMDISFRPRSGEASKDVAEVRSKVAMQIADNNQLHWRETEVFADGMIEQRGYFDCRMCWDDSELGELEITVPDPRNVIPDPDASSYNPSQWGDVIKFAALSLDEVEGYYGLKARTKAEATLPAYRDEDLVIGEDGTKRNRFGNLNNYSGWSREGGVPHVLVIDRQKWIRARMNVAISPEGDIRPLDGTETPEVMDGLLKQGAQITKRMVKRVRWQVSTSTTLLHDDWSPYDRLTIIPFFPFFRRGKTRGMVDGAVGGQKIFDKALSQAIHIVNTTANSGWQLEEGQVVNMTTDALEEKGASTGLILERKAGTPPLLKIPSNPMPQGIEKLIDIASNAVKDVTVPDAMRGIPASPNESGVTVQSRQHASQQILAVPLDNLSRTRHLLAQWIDYAITKYYDTERVFRITKTDPLTGQQQDIKLPINQMQPDGSYLNDMTAGEYDVVIAEQPMQITFDNTQFSQLMDMRKEGIRIPDPIIVKHSNVTDKQEIITAMEGAGAPADPLTDAKKALLEAQAEKAKAETVQVREEAQFSAIQTAKEIVAVPEIATVADQVYKSGGGQDQDQPPVFAPPPPGTPIGTPPDVRQNTSPLFPPRPASPGVGVDAGIEGGT